MHKAKAQIGLYTRTDVRMARRSIITGAHNSCYPAPMRSFSRTVDVPAGSIEDLMKSSRVRLSAKDSDLTVALTTDDGGHSMV